MKGGENKKTKGILYKLCVVQAKMCSMNQAHLYKLCVVQAKMCSMNQAHLQYKQGRSSSSGYREQALLKNTLQ